MASSGLVSPRLIGRDEECARLSAAFQAATDNGPVLAMISGEAGVGKSRLLEDFVRVVRHRGARALVGGCLEVSAGDLPYVPLRHMLRDLERELGLDRLYALLGPTAQDLGVILSAARPLSADQHRSAELPDAGRIFDLILHLVSSLGSDSSVVMVIDDGHWADDSTLRSLVYLLQGLRNVPLLVVIAYRPEDLPTDIVWRRTFERLHRQTGVQRINLDRLTARETDELIAAIRADIDDLVIERVRRRSSGVPFLVEELLAAELSGATPGVPPQLGEVLRLRLDALTPDARQVVRTVATVGRPVEHGLVATAAGLTDRRLTDALREAVDQQVLVFQQPDDYSFRHDIVREITYYDMLPGERSEFHRMVAGAMERILAAEVRVDATAAAQLSHHWSEARDSERAFAASLSAARIAFAEYAYPESARQYEQVLALWPRLSGSPVTREFSMLDIVLESAEAAHWAGQVDRARELLEHGLAAAESADPARIGTLVERLKLYHWLAMAQADSMTVDLEHLGVTATATRLRAGELMQKGHYRDSAKEARLAVEMARNAGLVIDEIRAGYILGVDRVMLGSVEEGLTNLRSSLQLAQTVRRTEEIITGYVNLSFALEYDGQLESSVETALAGIEAANQLGGAVSDGAMLAANAASALLRLGRLTDADQVVREALARGAPPVIGVMLRLVCAELDTLRGNFTSAHEALDALQAESRKYEDYQIRGQLQAARADYYLWTAHPLDARRAIDLGLAALEGDEDVLLVARLCWLGVRADADIVTWDRRGVPQSAGEIGTALDDASILRDRAQELAVRSMGAGAAQQLAAYLGLIAAEDSRALDRRSPELWHRAAESWTGYPYLASYCHWREAEALRSAKKLRPAAEALRAAHASAVASGMRPLSEAVELCARLTRVRLDEAAEARVRQDSEVNPFGLTNRELDVLRLLTDGLTNRLISRRLAMSEKTASVHVSRILAKMQVSHRGEAAALAHYARIFEEQVSTNNPTDE